MRSRWKVVVWVMKWLHNHWISNCYWQERQSNWKTIQNASMILILRCFSHKNSLNSKNATRMLGPKSHEFCWILKWFCLLCHMLRHKNINYAKFSYSNLQLPAYTAYKSQRKIKNLTVRHLTRPYILDSCWREMLFWHLYTTTEASRFRNNVPKIILAKCWKF